MISLASYYKKNGKYDKMLRYLLQALFMNPVQTVLRLMQSMNCNQINKC